MDDALDAQRAASVGCEAWCFSKRTPLMKGVGEVRYGKHETHEWQEYKFAADPAANNQTFSLTG